MEIPKLLSKTDKLNTLFFFSQSTFFIFQKLNIQSKFFPKYFHRQRIKNDFNYTHMVTILP